MPVQLTGIGVTVPSVGVSLTPNTIQLQWTGESLIQGFSILGTTAAPSNSSASLNYSINSNSQYVPLLVP